MDENSILKLIRTTSDQSRLINLIEHMQSNIFKKTPDYSFLDLESAYIKNLLTTIEEVIKTKNLTNNRTEIEKFLELLLLKTSELNVMKISIAIDPSDKLINDLKDWANKNVSVNTIFDITIDPQIQGGAIIINDKGDYINYSLTVRIDQNLVSKQQELMAILQ